ncbi:MAG TPA: site-specific integrase [Ignavibacteria bacterium]
MFLSKIRGYYYLFFTDETGRNRKKSCRTKYKPEALKFLSEFKQNSKLQIQKFTILNISDLRNEVMKYVSSNLRPGTVKIYNIAFDNLIRILTDKPIRLITPKDVEYYKEQRLKEVTPSTLNIDILTLKSAFNIGKRLLMLDYNPLDNIKKIRIENKLRLCFTTDEIKLMINNSEYPLKEFIIFALHTAMRLGEIVNIQMKEIDFENRIIQINNKDSYKTKSGQNRSIGISDELFDVLMNIIYSGNVINYFNPDKYLFANEKGFPYRRNYISMEFKKLIRKLGLNDNLCFHCLRHSALSNLIQNGADIETVKTIAGHSTIRVTENYLHTNIKRVREAMNKINYK